MGSFARTVIISISLRHRCSPFCQNNREIGLLPDSFVPYPLQLILQKEKFRIPYNIHIILRRMHIVRKRFICNKIRLFL